MARPIQHQAEQALAAASALEAVASALKTAVLRSTTDPQALLDAHARIAVITQKARAIQYDVARKAAESIASGEDIKTIVTATQALEHRIHAMSDAQTIVRTAVEIAEAAVLVVGAIMDPTHATSAAAVSAIAQLAH